MLNVNPQAYIPWDSRKSIVHPTGQTEQGLLLNRCLKIERERIGPGPSNRVLTIDVIVWEDQTEGKNRAMGIALWLRHREANVLLKIAQETELSQGSLCNPPLTGSKLWTSEQELTMKTQYLVNRVLTSYVKSLEFTDHEFIKVVFLSMLLLTQLKPNSKVFIQMPGNSGVNEVGQSSHRTLLELTAHTHQIDPYQCDPVGNRDPLRLKASVRRGAFQETASVATM